MAWTNELSIDSSKQKKLDVVRFSVWWAMLHSCRKRLKPFKALKDDTERGVNEKEAWTT